MDGSSHRLVANLALACLEQPLRHILYPRWGGIESGATLSDDFRVMWEIREAGSTERQLVHRCYLDSDDPRDHGCVTHASSYATGSLGFAEQYMAGELGDAYTEDSFLENLGMFLGVVSHHVADLCTPVHVGHRIDFRGLGFRRLSSMHRRVEKDIGRHALKTGIKLRKPRVVDLEETHFWDIARTTYEEWFLALPHIYGREAAIPVEEMAATAVGRAVTETADVWLTVLSRSKMLDRKWSMQPLL